jgi:hypothetical protein
VRDLEVVSCQMWRWLIGYCQRRGDQGPTCRCESMCTLRVQAAVVCCPVSVAHSLTPRHARALGERDTLPLEYWERWPHLSVGDKPMFAATTTPSGQCPNLPEYPPDRTSSHKSLRTSHSQQEGKRALFLFRLHFLNYKVLISTNTFMQTLPLWATSKIKSSQSQN